MLKKYPIHPLPESFRITWEAPIFEIRFACNHLETVLLPMPMLPVRPSRSKERAERMSSRVNNCTPSNIWRNGFRPPNRSRAHMAYICIDNSEPLKPGACSFQDRWVEPPIKLRGSFGRGAKGKHVNVAKRSSGSTGKKLRCVAATWWKRVFSTSAGQQLRRRRTTPEPAANHQRVPQVPGAIKMARSPARHS